MIKIIIFSICLSYVWVFILKVGELFVLKRGEERKSIKPYNCEVCMSGWFALWFYFLSFFPKAEIYVNAVGWMATAMVAELLLNRVIDKL